MTEFLTKVCSIRGIEFKIACFNTSPCHPSWFTYEDEKEVRERDWNIQPGDLVFDIGAGHGSYTLTALAQGAAYVFAWCPQGTPGEPSEAKFLLASLKLNGWEDKVTIVRGGLWSETGILHEPTQRFYPFEGEAPDTSVKTYPTTSQEWIAVRSFDQWFKTAGTDKRFNPQAKFWMKLDVEGAEAHVLHGAKDFIRRFWPTIQIENHPLKASSLPLLTALAMDDIGGYRLVHDIPYNSVSHSLYVKAKA